MNQRARAVAALAATTLVFAACGDDEEATTDTAAASTDVESTVTTSPSDDAASTSVVSTDPNSVSPVLAGEAFPADRCAANEAAGTINYYTGFDYAAAASIVEVLVADNAGYYDDLCLDVMITPSFSTANYPLIAEGDVQFSSSGSFSEMATFSAANEAELVTLSVDGHVAIDSLMLKPDQAATLADVAGKTIGVKGALPPSVAAMLAAEGLIEGTDFETVLLDGFDPVAHMAVDTIIGLPGWKSNEPGALDRAGVDFDLYDPAEFGIPGSFGIIYTSQAFLDEHPTAVEDFMRATIRGLNDAIADPAAAASVAVGLINGNGNPNFLSEEGETFRWQTDAELITSTTPDGMFPGMIAADELAAEIAAYDAVGVYPNGAPPVEGRFSEQLVANLYTIDGTIIWPG
ncbi:MAG TPA: ABC transporter substrate-binding protein [Ilumatobacter sp.]|nr:ABC transporter substrate-binding protein [Ilumatobacter sp.]